MLGERIFYPDNSSSACTLKIDKVVVGDCEYGPRTGNQSKVIVAVFLSWTMPVPPRIIQVKLKGITKIFDPFDKGCPHFVQFILDPDGGNYVVDAAFNIGNCKAIPVTISLPAACDPPVCSGPNAIGGKLFSDFNNNGIKETSEIGLANIEVRLYDDAKQLYASTTTKTNGLWAIDNLIAGKKLRVEYQIPGGLFDSNTAADNKTRTQISSVGDCAIDLGIFELQDVIDPDPWMAVGLFQKGDATNPSGSAFLGPTIVLNLYNTTEGGPRIGPDGNYYVASAGETGSVWGLGYQKNTRQLISASFLKRNASLGPGGLGGIYITDLTNFLPTPTPQTNFQYYGKTKLLVNLDSFGINTGDEMILYRNLPFDPNQASHDSLAFDKIGKWGLGGLDLNDAGDTLFVVNMYNRSLITIAIGNPIKYPITPDRIIETPIPDPACATYQDWRPWGLKYKDAQLYVGGVCSAESTDNSDDLFATIYSYSKGNFKKVSSFDLNYTKGFLNANYCSTFRPWHQNFYRFLVGGDVTCGPVPVLSDIEFDSEGNMIVSVGDRYGYQTGGRDYGINQIDNVRYLTFAGGDNLKLFKLKDEYLLEQNGTSGFYTTNGANNNQGVCGGEFYYQDGFYSHQEGALGALASHPSYNTVVATLMDPANVWSNGWSQLNNSLGTKQVNYNIFSGENGTFGKSAGLGDIELLVGSSTPKGIGVSIGNFVWNDLDHDGIQDPGENPISNLPLLLFDTKDSLLQQTVTNKEGIYYFKDLEPYTEYILQIGNDTNYFSGELLLNGISYTTAKFHSRVNYGNAENDSDASRFLVPSQKFINKIAYYYLSGKEGENNFSLDFGLLTCSTFLRDTLHYEICLTDSVKVGDKWFSAENTKGEVDLRTLNVMGCDSIVYVATTFYKKSQSRLDTTICKGSVLDLYHRIFDENNTDGIVLLPNKNQFGCDSFLDVHLHFYNPAISRLDTSICKGSYITLHNKRFDETNPIGDIVLPASNQWACDSTISVHLNFLSSSAENWDTSICQGSFLLFHGQKFDQFNPTGKVTLANANKWNCDSIISVELHFLPSSHASFDTAICAGDYIILHNQRFDESKPEGQILLSGMNSHGCDSILHVNLQIHPIPEHQFDTSICPKGNVIIHNKQFDENTRSGRIILKGSNQFGCDSAINVQLRIKPDFHLFDTIESCVEYTWPVTGTRYLNSGNFRFNGISYEGCDSTFEMQLTIHPEYKFYDTLCALNHFKWSVDQKQYDQTGDYEYNHRTMYGCDSIEYLSLMIVTEGDTYVPNVFTPNGDNVNDKVYVFANKDVHTIDYFAIYDRWGEQMHEAKNFPPNDPQFGWNGIHRNLQTNPAVFVYLVEWHDKFGGFHKKIGDVTLVR